jgi:hypothetical protein
MRPDQGHPHLYLKEEVPRLTCLGRASSPGHRVGTLGGRHFRIEPYEQLVDSYQNLEHRNARDRLGDISQIADVGKENVLNLKCSRTTEPYMSNSAGTLNNRVDE